MANNNPHSIDDEVEKKLVSLEALTRYHHNLIAALGLIQDTGEYVYDGERTDYPVESTTVQDALDRLYDMCKKGALEFNSGKYIPAEGETVKEVKFDTEDEEESNLYWINAKVGDEIVNIQIDANDFVKDSVLESVIVVSKEGDAYKVNGVEATYTPAGEGTPSKLVVGEKTYQGFEQENDGVYFHYTWKVDEGEKGVSYNYTTIAIKDIYGDIKGDDYITFDATKTQIIAQTADVVSTPAGTTKYSYSLNDVEGLQDALTEAGIDFTVDNETGNIIITDTVITETGLQEIIDQSGVPGVTITKTGETTSEGKVWSVASEDDTNLATAENLADVANELQQEIEDNAKKNQLIDGTVTLSTEEGHSLVANVTEEGSSYDLTLKVTGDTDVDGMFVKCGGDRVKARKAEDITNLTPEQAANTDLNVSNPDVIDEALSVEQTPKTYQSVTIDEKK